VHPSVLEIALNGWPEESELAAAPAHPKTGLSSAERDLMAFLERSTRPEARRRARKTVRAEVSKPARMPGRAFDTSG
jgi:hypothetical protein